MAIQPSEIAHALSEKFQLLHAAFTDLASDAGEFHRELDVTDASKRGLFTSLSKIMAFCDHVHIALNLMAEDVMAIEAAYGDPKGTAWNRQLQDAFDEWCANTNTPNLKIH